MATYNELLDVFKAELTAHEGYKRKTIVLLAKKLEEEGKTPLDKISEKLGDDLEGYENISRRYIRVCLEDKYKNRSQQREKEPEREEIGGTSAARDVIEVSSNGQSLERQALEEIEEEKESSLFHDELAQKLDERGQDLPLVAQQQKQIEVLTERNKQLEDQLDRVPKEGLDETQILRDAKDDIDKLSKELEKLKEPFWLYDILECKEGHEVHVQVDVRPDTRTGEISIDREPWRRRVEINR